MGVKLFFMAAVAALIAAPQAAAEASWLPHPEGAEWVYEWSNTEYTRAPAKEKITVKSGAGKKSFVLAWTTQEMGNSDEAPVSIGTVAFQQTNSGIINTDWQSTLPPPDFPILCARPTQCGNSLASTWYLVIWGGRAPMLSEPLLAGSRWTATGGADGDVTSASQYLGREKVVVPAFPEGVVAAKVRSDITQAGALGDPFGSGVRTVWWVFGVGPVKIVFEHAGGADAPVTTSVLQSTNQKPEALPPHTNWFPLKKGAKMRFGWTNTKHFGKQRSVQEFVVDETANNSARVSAKHIGKKGPIRVAGSYGFSLRTDGVTNIWAVTQAASLAKLPPLGPKFLDEDKRRHFFTPFDLMVFGFNPLIPAYPTVGASWSAKSPSRDFSIFGVVGTAKVIGMRTVKVPAGMFRALAVQTSMRQAGFKFGSGTRTSYFAAGKGLVKLVFRHKDGSVSVVERLQ